MTRGRAPAGKSPDSRRGRRRGQPRFPHYGWAGTVGALIFASSSFTPSLLPRTAVLQGVLAGIAGAFGYGMGEALAWGVRRVSRWRPSPVLRRRAWLGLAVVGGAFIVVTLIAGWRWQVDIHRL